MKVRVKGALDVLDLEYNREMYIKVALQIYPTHKEASQALGLSTRTLSKHYGSSRPGRPKKGA